MIPDLGIPELWVPDWAWVEHRLVRWAAELWGAAVLMVWRGVRMAGVVVQDGERGLKFSFGRVTGLAEPGLHLLIPVLQTVRKLPVRARTLDVEAQRCTARDGQVFNVDANVVWQVFDVRRALVEVADLQRALRDALAVSVQEVIRSRPGRDVGSAGAGGSALDDLLRDALSARVAAWGVQVVTAGFVTAAPSAETLRITQLGKVVAARRESLHALESAGLSTRTALTVLGTRVRLQTRAVERRRRVTYYERARRLWVTKGRDLELPDAVLRHWERAPSA